MKKQFLFFMVLCQSMLSLAWSGSENAGDQPIFFGKLTSQEGKTFNVTNIIVGRSETGGRSVRVYEMPRTAHSTAGKDKVMITLNPYQDLTTTELDLLKVKKIVVPHAQTSWIWEKKATDARTPASRYEFIELEVTWHGGQTSNYLLELGMENSSKPVKVFCDSTNNPIVAQDAQPMFCVGIKQDELRKKGAPFPSIKELIIDGHCYKAPSTSSPVGMMQPRSQETKASAMPAPMPMVQPEPMQPAPVMNEVKEPVAPAKDGAAIEIQEKMAVDEAMGA